MRAHSAPNSGSFMSSTGLDLHRAATENTPEEIHDAQCRIQHNTPEHEWRELTAMLFKPPSDVERWGTGRRK